MAKEINDSQFKKKSKGTRFAKVIVIEMYWPQKLLRWPILSQDSVKKKKKVKVKSIHF